MPRAIPRLTTNISTLATSASVGAGTDVATADGTAGSVHSKLRRVDVAVSTRATPADLNTEIGDGIDVATADGVAGTVHSKLRRVDVAVSSRLASIKSLQKGTIALNNPATAATATITSVDTAKAFVMYEGASSNQAGGGNDAYLDLTNATTVTAYLAVASTGNIIVGFTVVEFN